MPSVPLPPGLGTLAARQHAVVSGRQLLESGLSRRQIRYRVEQKLLFPMFGDTFRCAGAPVTPPARYMSATLAVPGSLLAGAAAAHLLGFPGWPPAEPQVIAGTRSGHRVGGVAIRRSDAVLERHRTRVAAIPVTTIARTVLDLAGELGHEALADLVDSLVTSRRLGIERLFDEYDRIAGGGRRGTERLRRVLVERLGGRVIERSELERHGREFLDAHGLTPAAVEFRPPWAGRAVARVDVAYVAQRVVVEFDGRRWHDRDDRFETDRLRDQLALASGWVVVRITWRQLHDDAAGVAQRLRATLERRNVWA